MTTLYLSSVLYVEEEILCFFTALRKTSFLNTGNVAIGKSTGCATPDGNFKQIVQRNAHIFVRR
jgi:hypothetical protein